MRLIDADKLLERMKKGMESGSNLNGTFDLYIEHAPTVKPNGDLISRHDAFRTYQVKVCHDVACSECQTIDADGTCRIEAWLKDIPSADRPTEWIPCSERMPDAEYGEGDSVLCCTETGLMYILYWNGGNWCVPTGEPHIWVNHKTGWHDRVIAWMPLPTPYKGGEE